MQVWLLVDTLLLLVHLCKSSSRRYMYIYIYRKNVKTAYFLTSLQTLYLTLSNMLTLITIPPIPHFSDCTITSHKTISGLFLLDLLAAFDTFDHRIFLYSLSSWLGLSFCSVPPVANFIIVVSHIFRFYFRSIISKSTITYLISHSC